MPTNDFLPFANSGTANVLTQADYAALAARGDGFSSGIAKSQELNKVWRQSSVIAASLAKSIVDSTGLDVLDDGDIVGIAAKILASIAEESKRRCLPRAGGADMSGLFRLAGDATDNLHPVTKQQLDSSVSAVPTIGGPQTWQNVTGSRSLDVTYYNQTTRPVVVCVTANTPSSAYIGFQVDGVGPVNIGVANGFSCATFIVPVGSSYKVTKIGAPTVTIWQEMR